MKRKIHQSIFLIVILLLATTLTSVKTATRKVRVAYPLMEGLTMKDEKGNYYGYDYDYLMQIAQYTGWEYEFVEVDGNINERLTKLMDMLKKGEIDIMSTMKYSPSLANDYDYASEPYGNAYNVIAVKDDSVLMDVNSLISKKDLKIAVLNSASARVSLLDQYAEMNGFTYEKIVYTSDTQEQMVKDNKVDALLSVDLSIPKGYHAIARFSPDPFYFVTTKGNTQIINSLNEAINNINQVNPTFPSTLYNRYFSGDTDSFILNATEKDFIKEHNTLNVLVRDGIAPIQYLNQDYAMGVGKDILTAFCKNTGIKVNYISAKDYKEYEKLANSEKIDLLLGVPFEPKIADTMNVTLSDPYLTSSLTLVTNKKVNPTQLSDKNQATTHYNNELYDNNTNLSYYDSPEKVLKAIDENASDYAYVNTYLYTYYSNKYNFQNLTTFNAPDYLRSQYSFGVTKTKDLTLLSLLNKSIRSQESSIESYVYKNAYKENSFNISSFLRDNILVVVLFAILSIMIIAYFIRAYYNKELKMKKAVELEYMRYQMLSDISGEMTFTYDYLQDELKISNSGLHKISNTSILKQFSKITTQMDGIPGILLDIQSFVLTKKDNICEKETAMLNGPLNWYQFSIKIIFNIEKNKETAIYAVGKVLDIQKDKEERQQLLLRSQTDILTGILNRGAAQDSIKDALINERGLGALIMIDLDNFKNVNDDYGHIEGDQVLIETAQLLTEVFSGNIVARLGGDEFVIYLRDITENQVHKYCEESLSLINNMNCLKGKNLSISMSMGIVYTTYSKDYMQLLQVADEKLYEVKRSGRNGYKIHH